MKSWMSSAGVLVVFVACGGAIGSAEVSAGSDADAGGADARHAALGPDGDVTAPDPVGPDGGFDHGPNTGPVACVPYSQVACSCGDGVYGARTCGADGDYGPCVCQVDAGLDAAALACAGGYVGMVGPVGPVWGNATDATPAGFGPAANGLTGLAAGRAACARAFAGTHACTWEELKVSDACGRLTAVKNASLKAWLHRTGLEIATATRLVDDNPALPPGPPARGGRCNDWTSADDLAYDGEWVEFGNGVMKAHLDSDTADDLGAPSAHAAAGVLQCNGQANFVLCCK